MIRDYVCEHGSGPTKGNLAGVTWMGPIGICECCGCHFGYINSMNMSNAGSTGRTWTPIDRCGNCGGGYREF